MFIEISMTLYQVRLLNGRCDALFKCVAPMLLYLTSHVSIDRHETRQSFKEPVNFLSGVERGQRNSNAAYLWPKLDHNLVVIQQTSN